MLLREAAGEAGMTKRAVKYYEEEGLLSVEKDSSGYRNYSKEDVERLKKISVYRKLGIGIRDIRRLLETDDRSILLQIYREKIQEKNFQEAEINALKQLIDDGDADQANELLDYEQNVKIAKNTRTEGITEGEIEFKHVIFGYSGATDVIADVSFTAKPGQTTAFIGTTGSGKTTIMNLILRLYEMNFGEIKIDGTSIRDYDSDYLRSRISYATQKPMVFQDTVKNNIMAYDENCSQERMMAACDASEFAEVLEKLPNGLETEMAQGGMNISGGQRQRLSLARTLAKDADIYIFDDTFSALDAKTEASARRKIKEMLKGKTVLMVAQKISTIVDADQIVVLDRGRIAGKGTHEELLKNCKEYQEIYQTQCYVGKEEM